ncbi:achaete-scute homolog 5 [Perognathus longimembris pacificus]|uniref:achaete-scute homolog 5 n=1 Tax=Perognathus longimembris pacificus TaxID=214514 RepID=UPI002019ABE7|nr:achaete-scute homolog 5 [Perognathus longimembris pacificus]
MPGFGDSAAATPGGTGSPVASLGAPGAASAAAEARQAPAGAAARGLPWVRPAPPPAAPFLLYPGRADPPFYEPYAGVFPCAPFPGGGGGGGGGFGAYDGPLEPAFIQKRNERERQRVKCVNAGYARLRGHLPGAPADRRLSKVETLRAAIRYIKHLQALLGAAPDGADPPRAPPRAPHAPAPPEDSEEPGH